MSLLTCNSVYCGYDYYSSDKVIMMDDVGGGQFKAFPCVVNRN